MMITRVFSLLILATAVMAGGAWAQSTGSGGGGGSGSGSSGSGSDSGDTGTPATGTGVTNPADEEFNPGDAAPRTEPRIREDDFNTRPRVPAAPVDADDGGSGSTGGEPSGDIPSGTIDPPDSNDAGTGEAAEGRDDTIGDRSLTRQPNGTEGSRPASGSTIR